TYLVCVAREDRSCVTDPGPGLIRQVGFPPGQGGKPNRGPLPVDTLPLYVRPEVLLSSFLPGLCPPPGRGGWVCGGTQEATARDWGEASLPGRPGDAIL